MDQNLGKALENLATRSAWTLDEAVLLLTGKTSSEIESALSKCPPWPINTKWILMRKTKTVELGAGRAAHFKKGEITPTSEDILKCLIRDGSGEEAEAPYDLKQEWEDYSKAQDQSKLLETLKRAVLDNDIKSLNDSCRMLQPPEWRLEGKSFVDWVHARKEDISPLRHFPGKVDDILTSTLLLSRAAHSTTKGFPPPTLNNWSQVSFCALSDARFEIQVAGKNYSQEEVFWKSPPEYLIHFLYQIIHNGGTFDSSSFGNLKKSTVREYKDRLNKLLKERFGINTEPIAFNQKAKQYTSEFKCESAINTETDSADYSPEGNTPPGVSTDKIRKSSKYNE